MFLGPKYGYPCPKTDSFGSIGPEMRYREVVRHYPLGKGQFSEYSVNGATSERSRSPSLP